MKMGAKELRIVDQRQAQSRLKKLKRQPLYLILEDVYDTYNTGGLFRLADALAVERMYLCGEMEIPPNSHIQKASIGTYKVVRWEYKKSAREAIDELKKRGVSIVAVEQDKRARVYTEAKYSFPLALVVGNETTGITPETLALCDQVVEIPMWGINKSLNVIISAAIVGYWLMVDFKK